MRSILEKAIVALLNEESEQAEALFHKFMVERARQIHESLRQGEDAILENFDEDITSEQYFTEEDLDDVEDTAADDVAGDEAGDDFGGDDVEGDDFGGEDDAADVGAEGDLEGDDFDMDADAAGDDLEGDLGGEGDDLETKVSDLEAQLEQLQAEFEELMGGAEEGDLGGEDDLGDFGGDDEAAADDLGGDDLGGDDFGGADDFGGEADADAVEDDKDAEDADAAVRESEEEDDKEEDFEDISESIVSELEKISVSLSDGKEIGTGKSFTQNGKSPALQKKPNPMTDGKPITVKAEEHKGFEREEAPSVKDMKKRKNTRTKSTDGTAKASKEGDKSAELNKLKAPDVKSPLAKR